MQAFADNATEKIEHSLNNESMTIEDASSLFANKEIIFPDENAELITTRYGYIVADLHFLVPENITSEIIQDPKIFVLPNSPYWIEGLINIRGNIIPVMNIEKYLKKSSKKKMDKILVLNKSDDKNAMAFLISELPVSLELSDESSGTTEYPEELREYISEGFIQKGKNWAEFNPQLLFEKLAGRK